MSSTGLDRIEPLCRAAEYGTRKSVSMHQRSIKTACSVSAVIGLTVSVPLMGAVGSRSSNRAPVAIPGHFLGLLTDSHPLGKGESLSAIS
jgi:hypothetical protein